MNIKYVIDISDKSAAKSKPQDMGLDALISEIDTCYDAGIGDGEPPHYHESLDGPCIPYLDYDGPETETDADRIPKIKAIQAALRKIFTKPDILMADRSGFSAKLGRYKLSIRAYVRGVGYFSCPQACGEFLVPKLVELIGEGIDLGAYKRNQNMGMLFNTKRGDERILQPLTNKYNRIVWNEKKTSDLMRKSLIQIVEGESVCLDPAGFEIRTQQIARVSSDTSGVQGVIDGCIKLMPGLLARKVHDHGDHVVIEFFKSEDECAICKRVHKGNRAYATYFPLTNTAIMKCQDKDADGKRIKIVLADAPINHVEEKEIEEKVSEESIELKLLRGSHTNDNYAKYVIAKYPGRMILVNQILYYFAEGAHTWTHWAPGDDGYLYNFLADDVLDGLVKVLDKTYHRSSDLKEKTAISKKLVDSLQNWSARKGIVNSIKARIQVKEDPFDKQPHLFGFANGIYDLDSGVFRAGCAADMVACSAPYDYAPVGDEQKAKLMTFINQIMPREDERDFLLRGLASGLYGKTLQNLFILTGEGGNGKDTLVSKLYRDTIGRDHYEYSNTTNLTEKRKGDISQSLANMSKKRAVVWSEPPKNAILQIANIKEITGGDQINARAIFSANTEIKITASCFMLCNDIPKLDHVDGGISRRLLVVPFRSLFKSPEDIQKMANTTNVYEANGYYDSQAFRDEFRLTFFNILIEHFAKFRAHGYMMKNVPQTIQDMSASYVRDSDEFMMWFDEHYEKTEDANAYISVKELYELYKSSDLYVNLSKAEKRAMNLKKMTENITKSPTLRTSFDERFRPQVGGVRKECRNVLVKYQRKSDDSDSDEE